MVYWRDEGSRTESKSVAMHRHYSAHRFCHAHGAFTCRRDHYSLPVRYLVTGKRLTLATASFAYIG